MITIGNQGSLIEKNFSLRRSKLTWFESRPGSTELHISVP